jgi:hypothetical protein
VASQVDYELACSLLTGSFTPGGTELKPRSGVEHPNKMRVEISPSENP